jgi:ADP-ribose pyrophosphatase YjhB (NUDIX family)
MDNTTRKILPAVAAAIFDKQGNVLLQFRQDVGQWGIISGHVEFGETIANAILREIFEETNAHARIIRLIGIYSSPASQTYDYDDATVHYVTTYFEAKFIEEVDLQFHNNETGALKFFHPQHLPTPLAQMHPKWLEDALSTEQTPYLR